MKKELTIGLFGFGCVGKGLYDVLDQTELINANLKHIVVKDKSKKRAIDERNFSFDPNVILEDDEINTVVELIDDAEAAYHIVIKALKSGKNVVSANKKLIANHLEELIDTARKNKVSFLYEAAVCASIPIIRTLEEYYNTDSISKVEGICNGTTNYIFSQTDNGKSYADALREAQDLGFAESDPTLDVDGFDAKYKLSILIKHAFGLTVDPDQIFNYGIRHVKSQDVQFGKEKNYRLKLISNVIRDRNQLIPIVAPHFVKEDHPTYNVNDSFNAVAVKGLFSDQQTLVGRGAGAFPTASAVLSDISALQFDYKYEYRKEILASALSITDNYNINVYIGSTSTQELAAVRFEKISEEYHGNDYHYTTGFVSLSTLKDINFNDRSSLFLAVLPEKKKESLDKTNQTVKTEKSEV